MGSGARRVAGLALFLWWETPCSRSAVARRPAPAERVFTFSNLATFVSYASTSAMIFLMSLYHSTTEG